MTKQTVLLACIALLTIKHNGKDYKDGDVIYLSEVDAGFLFKSGFARKATEAELEVHENSTETQNHDPNEPPAQVKKLPEDTGGKESSNDNSSKDGETQPPANPEPVNYEKWVKADLIAELDKRGINHEDASNNEARAALLTKNDAEKAASAANSQGDE